MPATHCQLCGREAADKDIYRCPLCKRLHCTGCFDYSQPTRCSECGVLGRAEEIERRLAQPGRQPRRHI